MDFGVLDKYSHLPVSKLKAIELLATKGLEHNMSLEEIAEECNITRKTLWAWRSEKEFNDALMAISKEINRSVLPKVLSRLAKEVDTASARDITNIARLLFQFHGELTEKTEVTMKEQPLDIESILNDIDKL